MRLKGLGTREAYEERAGEAGAAGGLRKSEVPESARLARGGAGDAAGEGSTEACRGLGSGKPRESSTTSYTLHPCCQEAEYPLG